MIVISWNDKPASDYVDVLPQDTFKEGTTIKHPTVRRGNKPYEHSSMVSKAFVRKFDAGFVELDYGGALAAENKKADCYIGVMRFPLTSASGNTVWWRDEGKTKFSCGGTAVFV
jgi:hypothetical protein